MNIHAAMQFYSKVFDLIASIAGASESIREDFVYSHARAANPCEEFRIQGKLGFGGKYRRKTNKVDCYPEDETPERLEIINRLNTELGKLEVDVQ